ncbi:MAG: DnaJ domain-containing protein [Spirochaetota bacterium]|nr:DnaJ domain-containing protein [Spirochaetota bacterium]
MSISYYDILNVPYTASTDDIKMAFRKLAKRYHPDVSLSGEDDRKLQLILEAYNILGDEELKKNYDRVFFKDYVRFKSGWGYIKLPRTRIEYAGSLRNLASTGMLARKQMKRRQRLANFGYDVSITLSELENRRGVAIRIPLPAKGVCDVCYGSETSCYACDGLGTLSSVEDLEVIVPPGRVGNSIIDIDLKKHSPKSMTNFTLRSLRLLIQLGND